MMKGIYRYAATIEWGKNIADTGLDNIFWLILLGGIAGAAVLGPIKKSWVAAGITLVATGIICYFIKNPTRISDIGETLANIIGW